MKRQVVLMGIVVSLLRGTTGLEAANTEQQVLAAADLTYRIATFKDRMLTELAQVSASCTAKNTKVTTQTIQQIGNALSNLLSGKKTKEVKVVDTKAAGKCTENDMRKALQQEYDALKNDYNTLDSEGKLTTALKNAYKDLKTKAKAAHLKV